MLTTLSGSGTGGLLHLQEEPARAAVTGDWPRWLDPRVEAAVRGAGITDLYSHQSRLAELAHSGQHAVLATGTASGKSLGYQLPVLSAVVAGSDAPTGRGASALYLAPTKALAADQLAHLEAMAVPGLRAVTVDGDTPIEERRWARRHANLVLTNPDLLHHTMLPGHQHWAPFLRALRYVVVDECHVYRGVFGSHTAAVLRRLRRVAALYRSEPTMVMASATVADPAAHAADLAGCPVQAVTEDGSPHGAVTVALWQPGPPPAATGATPAQQPPADDQPRRSAVAEAADLSAALVGHGVQTLTFARSRVGVETVADRVRRRTGFEADQVAAYRGGYLPEERRALEAGLRSGRIRSLAATSALELGIDVSGIDAVVIAGWPGTVSSLRQQAGRAGRAGSSSLAVLVADDDPMDTYLVHHPERVFGAPVEAAVLDPHNPYVLAPHLVAAAAEAPLTEADEAWFGPQTVPLAQTLTQRGVLRLRPRGWFWAGENSAAGQTSLRGAGEAVVRIVDARTGGVLGTVDPARAHSATHPGAVYVHQGQSFVVTVLDLDDGSAHVLPGDPGWSTQAKSVSTFDILDVEQQRTSGPISLSFGVIEVGTQVTSFLRRSPDGTVLGEHPLQLPERRLRTRGVWWTVQEDALADVVPLEFGPGALHAAEHCSIGMLPLVATSDRWDVGGVSTMLHPDTGLPTVVVYDGYPGGAGFAGRGHQHVRTWLGATRSAIADCPCRHGCPGCIQSPKCGNGNEPLHKAGAMAVLDLVLRHL
ncbi:DEAD/DEAH box helicase [Dermacoccaceae bacterium W4C1]